MRNDDFAVSMNRGGELLQGELYKNAEEYKYKADNPFFWGPVPYILMAICIVIDIAFFRSLFTRISYDDPTMLWLEVAGLAFAADIVAAYAGILAKKIDQGLSRNRRTLYLLLSIPILALIVNGVLRVATMSLGSVDGTVDASAIALTIVSIVMPVLTSTGNLAISFETYDPLKKKMYREERVLNEVRDYCRRLEAIKEECDDFNESRMKEMDRKQLETAKKELISDALALYADMREKLMEHLGDPASTNVLSQMQCETIFDRLNQELKALEMRDMAGISEKAIEPKGIVKFTEVA